MVVYTLPIPFHSFTVKACYNKLATRAFNHFKTACSHIGRVICNIIKHLITNNDRSIVIICCIYFSMKDRQ